MEDKENLTEQQNEEVVEVAQTEQVEVEEKQPETVDVEDKVVLKKKNVAKKKEKKVKEETSYEGLSDDEIYTKIQTDKLLKRKKNKRIATLVAMCFAFALAVCVIVLAVVPVSLKPRCLDNNVAYVSLHSGKVNADDGFEAGSDNYNKFMKLYNNAFSQPYISSIFSGTLFSYDIDEDYTDTSDIVGSTGTLIKTNSYFVRLKYNQDQEKTLTYQNGKAFKSKYRNSNWNGVLTFTEAYIEINKEAGFQETKVYVEVFYPKFKDGEEVEYEHKSGEGKVIVITIKADTSAIYDAWNDLV